MLTDAQEEIIGEALKPLFEYLEHEVIVDVAERIRATMMYSRTAEIEAQRLQQLGFSPAKIRSAAMKILRADPEYRKAVAKNTLDYKKKVKKLLQAIVREAQRAGSSLVQDSADLSYLDDLHTWKQEGKELTGDSFLPQIVDSIRQQTSDAMKNLTQTTGFKTMSGYEVVENLYQRELDKAMIKVCTGTFSSEKVIYDTVKSLAASGLRTIDFASGYSMQLDTAVKLAMRTGANQLSAKIMDADIQQMGENLVYVSTHWGARNTGTGHANHEQWQGKVYFIKEGTDYSAEAKRIGQDRITSLWYATGYSADGSRENDPLGLHGYNCRHKHYIWFLGASTLPKEDKPPEAVEIDGKTYDYYKITQHMRSMERRIRDLKREREALKALNMDTKEVSAKIKGKMRAYEDFCQKAGVKADINRCRYECGTSDLTKTKAWSRAQAAAQEAKRNTGRKVEFNPDYDYSITIDGYSKEVNVGLSEASRKVAELGGKDHNEHMYLVNLENGELSYYETNGLPREVGYEFWKELEKDTAKKYAFVHNHNTDGMLSETDLQTLLSTEQVPVMIAVRNDAVKYIAERKGGILKTAYYDELYEEDIKKLNEKVKNGIITVAERTKEREVIIVENLLRDFTKGGKLIEQDGRK